MVYAPEHYANNAQVCLDEIASRKDDPEFNEAKANLLLLASIAQSLQGLLSAAIHDIA